MYVCLSIRAGFSVEQLPVIASAVKPAEDHHIASVGSESRLALSNRSYSFSCICKTASYITICLLTYLVVCLSSSLFLLFLTYDCSNTVFFYRSISQNQCEVLASNTYYITWMLSTAQQQTFHHLSAAEQLLCNSSIHTFNLKQTTVLNLRNHFKKTLQVDEMWLSMF